MRRICVFCGSRTGSRCDYAEAAVELASVLARARIGIVYGGASVGVMGALADAAVARGAEIIGVIPELIRDKEIAHRGLSELHVVESMHERKALMGSLSDAFIALPGGLGTLEELFEVLTWNQLGIHDKPCGLLNTSGFFDALTGFLDHAAAEAFISDAHRGYLLADSDPAALVAALQRWHGS